MSPAAAAPPLDTGIVVISRNDGAALERCLRAVAREAAGMRARLTVILNACTDGSAARVRALLPGLGMQAVAFGIAYGDKANAWNRYVHELAPPAFAHVFIDGYAVPAPGTLRALTRALAADPHPHAATALPGAGPSAGWYRRRAARDGALHGSCHALREAFLDRIRARGLRLPIGLYWGDGLVGSYAMHDLDPAGPWDPRRVAIVPAASWRTPAPHLLDWRRHLRRRVNQTRGRWENAAIRALIYAHGGSPGYAALPAHADPMVRDWLARHPEQARRRDWAARAALRQLEHPRLPDAALLAAAPLAR